MTGYERRSARGGTGLAVGFAADWLEGVLSAGQTLHGWASERSSTSLPFGRGEIYAADSPFPQVERIVVRHYRRGGLLAPLLRDRYLRTGRTRPEREVRISAEARRRGIPTPLVVAAAWYGHGPVYRGDLVTEMIPGAETLADLLFSGDRRPDAEAALTLSGGLISMLEANSILHADLNAMNIVFSRNDGALYPHVIDLDRARITGNHDGHPMLLRLERSLRKLGEASGRPLAADDLTALRAAVRGS